MDFSQNDRFLIQSETGLDHNDWNFSKEAHWFMPTSLESEFNPSMSRGFKSFEGISGYTSKEDFPTKEGGNYYEENENIDPLFGNDEDRLDLTKDEHKGTFLQHDSSTNEASKEADVIDPELIKNSMDEDISSDSVPATRSASESSEAKVSVPFLKERLEKSFYDKQNEEMKVKKGVGRPRAIRAINKDELWGNVFRKHREREQRRMLIQRSDNELKSQAQDTINYLKEFKICVIERNRNTQNFKKLIETYAEAFTVGVLPTVFENEVIDNKIKSFCQFIVLVCKKPQATKIINWLKDEKALSPDECKTLLHPNEIRVKSSKEKFQELAKENGCFKNLIIKLLSKLGSIRLKDPQPFRDFLE